MKNTLIVLASLFLAACGSDGATGNGGGNTEPGPDGGSTSFVLNCDSAQGVYEQELSSWVDATCATSGCHGDGAGGLSLGEDSTDANRQALYGSSKLGSNGSHVFSHTGTGLASNTSGGGLSESDGRAALTEWHAAEVACE